MSSADCTACKSGFYKTTSLNYPLCYQSLSGFLIINQILTQCNLSCSQCSEELDKCTVCATGFYKKFEDSKLNAAACYNDITGYYLETADANNQRYFIICDKSCAECSSGSFSCTKCATNYYKKYQDQSGYCFLQLEQFFLDTINEVLVPCDPSCKTCQSSAKNCLICSTDFFIMDGTNFPTKCYSKPGGKFLFNNKWKPCKSPCAECLTTEDNCTSCIQDYFLTRDNPATCKVNYYGFYIDAESKWSQCNNNFNNLCPSCNKENCYLCDSDTFPTANYSIISCKKEKENPGFFLKNNVFYPCDPSCSTCEGRNDNCLTCASNYYSIKNTLSPCYTSLSNYYLNLQNFEPCDISCSECTGTSDTCKSCKTNYYPLFEDKTKQTYKCYNNYPKYYINTLQAAFMPCSFQCQSCLINENNCLICESGFYKVQSNFSNKTSCYKTEIELENKFILVNSFFKPCNASCMGCIKVDSSNPGTDTDLLNCQACASDYYPEEGLAFPTKCYNTRAGYFTINITPTESTNSVTVFRKCDDSCSTCAISEKNCLTCNSEYYKKVNEINNNNICYPKSSILSTQYLKNISTEQKIDDCDIVTCLTCQISPTNCLTCQNNYYQIEADITNLCYKGDQYGYFLPISIDSGAIVKYKKCDTSCLTCTGSAENCILCKTGVENYYPIESDLNKTSKPCYKIKSGYFLNKMLSPIVFQPCDSTICAECTLESKKCTKCVASYFVKEDADPGLCYNSPPDGYYLNSLLNKYSKCDQSCQLCSESNRKCSICASSESKKYYHKAVEDPSQIKWCFDSLVGYYLKADSTGTNKFYKCNNSCKSCTDEKTCIQCNIGYYYKQNDESKNCFISTLSGYFLNYSLMPAVLSVCSPSCKECYVNKDMCKTCADGYYKKVNYNKIFL